jgi:hypothetical protein
MHLTNTNSRSSLSSFRNFLDPQLGQKGHAREGLLMVMQKTRGSIRYLEAIITSYLILFLGEMVRFKSIILSF